MTNTELVSSLRELADFYEAHPALEAPYFGPANHLNVIPTSDHKRVLADFARAFGSADKKVDSNFFSVSHKFGAMTMNVITPRDQVCTRRVVATTHVPARMIPAETIPEHIEEVVEWDCPESLLAESTEATA